MDFRQKQWHGVQFDANYTWSHNLGLDTPDDWQGAFNQLTLRNLALGYGPTVYDMRHVANISGTYDLPFGKGKQFLNRSGLLDRVVGGWTVGTILTIQSGFPFQLNGSGYGTYNDYASGGVVLNGVSRSQLQNAVGVYSVPNSTFVDYISPGLLQSANGGLPNANTTSAIAYSNTSPGTLLTPVWLQGPHSWNDNLSITKAVPIRENLRFTLQGEFLNAFNHPNFNSPNGIDSNVGASGFGTFGGGNASGPRAIELRANIEF